MPRQLCAILTLLASALALTGCQHGACGGLCNHGGYAPHYASTGAPQANVAPHYASNSADFSQGPEVSYGQPAPGYAPGGVAQASFQQPVERQDNFAPPVAQRGAAPPEYEW